MSTHQEKIPSSHAIMFFYTIKVAIQSRLKVKKKLGDLRDNTRYIEAGFRNPWIKMKKFRIKCSTKMQKKELQQCCITYT